MHLILTHEQADFDALASLFGASLLDEAALPVLPRRINRNVRSFLILYGADFPFLDPRDLPQGKVDMVTLVDTQSLVTLKGMSAETAVRVVDHHPLRPGLPATWQVTIDKVGATTTLLVELLQTQNGHLTPVQATLLLLGIYEDTGSLTYARTTARDARACAWLLEHGASLRIAANFLNPPLSPAQRKLYESLLETAQTHDIHGHRIIVACGDAGEVDEEISTLAHKLRDLLDPDALFVLVNTQEGMRLVARSTTDLIDVSAIAAEFGGGGHDRAAAALVRLEPTDNGDIPLALEAARKKLLAALDHHVRPSVTVAQIMSRRPRLLKPETSLQEAARLMQRTGFEGFPVVDGKRVVGLLTRRAVDRALAHKLNLTAASLMEAGEVSVHPDDSLQTLQARMMESGWGQVPVADAEGHVVGIVTRTDLLKTLAPPPTRASLHNLSAQLEKALPPERLNLIRLVAAQAAEQRMAAYIVGGFVRDLLLERPSLDFDIVVEGDAIALSKALAKQHGGRVTCHTRFGTAKWFLRDSTLWTDASSSASPILPEFLDLITARSEFYEHPTALPTVERGSIKLDLHRRDFTINTLALRLDGHHYGELHDYWGGLADLERGLVRVLHSLSFIDDPTRMLRAVRYEQRYGLTIEARTRHLIIEARSLLERLSAERVRHELDLILDEEKAPAMLTRLAELDLLTAIHPALPTSGFERLALVNDPDSIPTLGLLPPKRTLRWLLWLAPVSPAHIRALSRRLRLSASLTKLLLAAAALHTDLPDLAGARPSAWVARLEDVPEFAVYAVSLCAEGEARLALQNYLTTWQHLKPHTTGHDLKRLGLLPGPQYQLILRRLRDAWLDGEISTSEQETDLLKQILSRQAAQG
ncbi:MAG: CBS domain-containing protein [Anaerolineales bacterium]